VATIYKKYDGVSNLEFSNQVFIVPCDYGDGQGAVLSIPEGSIWQEAQEALQHLDDATDPVIPEDFSARWSGYHSTE
jgi:hypothetical protein